MNQENQILKKADNFVFELFKAADTSKLLYHNYKHTYDVVSACNEIGKGSELNESDLEIVLLSAWFHDVGYLESCINHEELSVKAAADFFKIEGYDESKITQIKACILVTKIGVEPVSILEEVICDADMKGVSSKSYPERTRLLQAESELLNGTSLSEEEWLQKEVDFLTSHRYYTKYALLNFNESKTKNLIDQQSELQKISKKIREKNQKNDLKEKELNLKAKKDEIPEKGIDD